MGLKNCKKGDTVVVVPMYWYDSYENKNILQGVIEKVGRKYVSVRLQGYNFLMDFVIDSGYEKSLTTPTRQVFKSKEAYEEEKEKIRICKAIVKLSYSELKSKSIEQLREVAELLGIV